MLQDFQSVFDHFGALYEYFSMSYYFQQRTAPYECYLWRRSKRVEKEAVDLIL